MSLKHVKKINPQNKKLIEARNALLWIIENGNYRQRRQANALLKDIR